MSLILNPKDYGLENDGRLVIYNVKTSKYYEWRPVKKNTLVDISDQSITKNIIDYKFKFQERKDGKWIDVKNYFYLEKSRFIRQFWTGKINLEDSEIENILKYFSRSSESKDYQIIKEAVTRTVNYIMKSRQPRFDNLKTYFQVLDNSEIEMPLLWTNIHIYLRELIDIKETFHNKKLIGIPYNELLNKIDEDSKLNHYFNNKINTLAEKNMQFSDVLVGILYSFTGNRKSAYKYMNRGLQYDNNYIYDFSLGLGVHTYLESAESIDFSNKINFDYENNFSPRDITFTMAVDEMFLRKYGMQMFYSIIALKKYYFHFHVIADEITAKSVISEAQSLFNSMSKFFDTNEQIRIPTFSSENIPSEFVNKTTYFACARFVNAGSFMEKFNSDIVTLDADFVITDDLQKMIDEITKNDIAITITTGFTSLLPWTRYMGGTLYLKYNDKGAKFIDITRDYILNNMYKNHTWTLDQNALCFAYEKVKLLDTNIKIGDISGYPRPLTQPRIRRFIED